MTRGSQAIKPGSGDNCPGILGDTRKKSECSFGGVDPTTLVPITSSDALPLSYRLFSRDGMAAMLVSLNKGTAVMLVFSFVSVGKQGY